MKLSTKGRYAARLMLDLALNDNKGPVLLKDAAQREEISEKYLGHLILPLKTAGLINSSRGAHGGYILAKPAQDITLGDIIRAVEGELTLVECVQTPQICPRVQFCVTRDVWVRVSEQMRAVLDSTTLEDLANQSKEKQKLHQWVYSI